MGYIPVGQDVRKCSLCQSDFIVNKADPRDICFKCKRELDERYNFPHEFRPEGS